MQQRQQQGVPPRRGSPHALDVERLRAEEHRDGTGPSQRLHHQEHLNDTPLGEALREVHRVSRPGGYLQIADICPVAPEAFTAAGSAARTRTGTVLTPFGRTYPQRARRD